MAPVIALGMMTGRGVPTAMSSDVPRSMRKAGVVTTPPPMPNMPESTPETKPMATVEAQPVTSRVRSSR